MGSILASAIINRVAVTLFDTNNVTWARTEHLAWLNLAQRAISALDPAALNVTATQIMATGSRQTIPATGWTLLDVYCNMGIAPGTTPGSAVRLVSRKVLDAFNPAWRAALPQTVIRNFMFDAQDQNAFWVYPPSNGLGYLQINYAKLADDIAEGTAITLSDAYADAIVEYMLHRAYMKERVGDPTQSDKHRVAFERAVAANMAGVAANDPTNAFNPTKPGGDET